MKKRNVLFLLLGTMSLGALVGCGDDSDATYRDVTAGSMYGSLSEFSSATVHSGDVLQFKVTPSEDFYYIDSVTNNDKPCRKVKVNPDGSEVYQTTIQVGENKLKALYAVDETVDFVDKFKLQISDEVFEYVMAQQRPAKGQGLKTNLDFRRCGIEQARAPYYWDIPSDPTQQPVKKKADSNDVFVNYVDGDTTHVETNNLKYTVKIRYLNIDTPESTSEIEEWGLTASYFSKYIYTGEQEYWDYIKFSFPDGYEAQLKAGMTSIILLSKEANKHMSEITMESLNIGSTKESIYASDTDGNQRDLAYVWYATVPNPTKADFRCLNLEMVYQGFSFGVGSSEDTSEFVYKYFDAANLSAKANFRHLNLPSNAGMDKNYFYYSGPAAKPVADLSLEELYASASSDPDIGYLPESEYCNKKTLFRVTGYVSAKLKTAFYIQDAASYDNDAVINGTVKPYGLYVFTYSETTIKVGDYVSCVGAISSYGGTFQMQGISWSDTPSAGDARVTRIISSNHTIVPIKLTGAQFNSLKLPQVKVELTDNIWFNDFQSTYDSVTSSLAEGGSEEINKYNDAYPFYNTSNAPIFYGSFTAPEEGDNSVAINDETKGSKSGVRYDDRVIRFTCDQDITVTYGVDKCRSYRFFTGGEYWYNEGGAEYANENYVPANCPTDAELEEMFPGDPVAQKAEKKKYQAELKTFKRKYHSVAKTSANPEKQHGLICISAGYESTGGNRKMTAKIVSGSAVNIKLSEVSE